MDHGLYGSKVGARGQGPQAQGRGPRADHARRRALRAVLALPPLRARGHGDEPARVREPRRPHPDLDLREPPHRPRLRRQPGRRLPGGGAAQPRLPLQDAGLVPEGARVGLPRLLDRLQRRSWTSGTARCSACGPAATSTSTSPGCATRAARSTSRSRVTDRVSGARVRGAGLVGGRERRGGARPGGLGPEGGGRRLGLPRLAAGDERGRVRLQDAGRGGRGQARLPGRRPAPQGARAHRPRAAARRPQPEHAGLPRPGRRTGRRRRDPRGLPRREPSRRSSSRDRRSCASPRPSTRSRRCPSWP